MRIYYVIGFFFIASGVSFLLFLNQKKIEERIKEQYGRRGNPSGPSVDKSRQKTEPFNLLGSFSDLLDKHVDAKCQYSYSELLISIEGVVYTDGTYFRANSNITTKEGTLSSTLSSNMLYNGNEYYIWKGGDVTGFVINLDTLEPTSSISEDGPKEITKKFKFTCDDWEPMDNMFQPPFEITFIDFKEAYETVMKDPCSACPYVENEARRERCLEVYNCN